MRSLPAPFSPRGTYSCLSFRFCARTQASSLTQRGCSSREDAPFSVAVGEAEWVRLGSLSRSPPKDSETASLSANWRREVMWHEKGKTPKCRAYHGSTGTSARIDTAIRPLHSRSSALMLCQVVRLWVCVRDRDRGRNTACVMCKRLLCFWRLRYCLPAPKNRGCCSPKAVGRLHDLLLQLHTVSTS